jgi:uncharacterized protein YcfJ
MRSKVSLAIVVTGLSVAGIARADHGPRAQTVYVPIIDVEPLVHEVTITRPRQECWLETAVAPAHRPRRPIAGPVIAGGLIGGIIGHQFGRGRGNDAMTVIGTLAGSAIASEAALERERHAVAAGYGREVTTQRCELVSEEYTEERVDGYRVMYDYMGQRYATVMPEPPSGDRIRLRVTVEAAGY